MSIPETCTVLVVGGGPGGSYTASTLAREGIDTVLLEADTFPRYHIGESMIPSIRHFLRFIDLESTFDSYGFTKKPGASFQLSKMRREGYIDFLTTDPNNYSWNVIRSESDLIMLRHAAKCGAKVFEGVKVQSVEFSSSPVHDAGSGEIPDNPGYPVSAFYVRKGDGSSGTIGFKYIVDASGRTGLVSTKYMKNRQFYEPLKNVASWGYWRGARTYAAGTERENAPYFEALQDESGWAWYIPLHNGTWSVGVVMLQEVARAKKTASQSNSEDFYRSILKVAPHISELLDPAQLSSNIKSASDYSYSASSYAFPGARIVGDAACFIDPLHSSGVHIALMGALSASLSICAALRGDCDEATAAKWHSGKIEIVYNQFRMVVLSSYKQMHKQLEPILSDVNEDNLDRAFNHFKPISQGFSDFSQKLTEEKISKMVHFYAKALGSTTNPEDEAIKPTNGELRQRDPSSKTAQDAEELQLLHQSVSMVQAELKVSIASFGTSSIRGYLPRVEQGVLGLVKDMTCLSQG